MDSFPYVVLTRSDLVARHLAEATRIVRPGGVLLVPHLSYCGEDAADLAETPRWAKAPGSTLLDGDRPFTP